MPCGVGAAAGAISSKIKIHHRDAEAQRIHRENIHKSPEKAQSHPI
jgi:hypothetical protein